LSYTEYTFQPYLPLVNAPAKSQGKNKRKKRVTNSSGNAISADKNMAHQTPTADGFDTEVEVSDEDLHAKSKKQKMWMSDGAPPPLRRTG
jgi:hypothetical protein